MASFGHVAVGLAVARAWAGKDASRQTLWRAMVAFSALAMLPDADVIGFKFGVAYAAPWGHRGATHSLVAALVVSAAVMLAARWSRLPPVRTFVAALVAIGSHGLLDTLTDGGLGAALLWPFSQTRFFAPVTPLPVAPIGARMLSARGLYVTLVELAVFTPFLLFALLPRRRAMQQPEPVDRADG